MELNRMNEIISRLPAEQKTAILQLIDLKTEQDMKEITKSNEILKASIDSLKESLNDKVNHLENRINTVFWAIGILITLIIALKIFG